MASTPRTPFAPWDRRELPGNFTVDETARRVGHYKWFEMRMFELMAGWIATVPELDVKLRLGAHSYHHAFHSELWHKRLPELREMNPDRKTVSPNPEFEAFVTALGAPEGDDKTIEKLVGMYRVALPAVIATYTYHRNNTSSITDSPTIRSLNFCLNDDMEEWVEAEMTIQSLITNEAEARRAADQQAHLTTLLIASGGIAGPGSVGSFDLVEG
jgi:hypothetical protein